MKRGQKSEDFGGLTQAEVARRLGLSRARVAQLEKQALQKLRRALADSPLRFELGPLTKTDVFKSWIHRRRTAAQRTSAPEPTSEPIPSQVMTRGSSQ